MKDLLSGYLFPHPPIIVEEIGRGEEKKALKTLEGSRSLAKDIRRRAPETIIIITPHGPLFSDAISISVRENLIGDFKNFGNQDLKFQYENNLDLVQEIISKAREENIPIAKIDESMAESHNISLKLDHGAIVPLYFIGKEYEDFQLVHITYGLLPPKELYKFGKMIQKIILNLKEKTALVASGDLSHKLSNDGPYSYSPSGKKFDERLVALLKAGDLHDIVNFDLKLSEAAGECGLRSLMILAGFLDGVEIESEVLSYEGPFGVGYSNARFYPKVKEESEYVNLARKTIDSYVRKGKTMELPEDLSDDLLKDRKGAFVTLKKQGSLRGCIGTIFPMKDSLAEEIMANAISAAIHDPRFLSVKEEELTDLECSVDVLEHPEEIESLEELDVKKYGIIVSKGQRKGLLLPNLDGVDTPEDQLSIALEKAGIGNHENYKLERFEVNRYF